MGRPRWRRSLNQLGTANTAPDAGPVPGLLHARTQSCFERPARLCHQGSPPNAAPKGLLLLRILLLPSFASLCLCAPTVAPSDCPHVTHSLPFLSSSYLLPSTTRLKWSWRPRLHEWGRRRRPWGGQGKRSFYFQTLPSAFACCPRRRMPNHHTRPHPRPPPLPVLSCLVLSCQIIISSLHSLLSAPVFWSGLVLPSTRTCAAHAHTHTQRERLRLLSTNITTHTRLACLPACCLPSWVVPAPLPPVARLNPSRWAVATPRYFPCSHGRCSK